MLTKVLSVAISYVSPTFLLGAFWTTLLVLLVFVVVVQSQERSHSVVPPTGYIRFGRSGRSNLHDEFDAPGSITQQQDHQSNEQSNWRVKSLDIFPIKSCAAIELDESVICPTGLVWDREFSFAEFVVLEPRPDAPEKDQQPHWRFRTQRTPGYENLTLVKPELWFPASAKDPHPASITGGVMIVRYPHVYKGAFKSFYKRLQHIGVLPRKRSFIVPLDPPKRQDFHSRDVTIWKDTVKWFDFGKYVPSDFGEFVGAKNPFTLFRVDPERYREVFRCAPRKEQLGYQSVVGFQDAYPLHMVNLSSIQALGEKVKDSLPNLSVRRFRANIVTSGPTAYDEDDWKVVRIGEQIYYCACHTVRCKMPNVDPITGVRHRFEPDRTLHTFRRIDAGDSTNPCLGMQLVPAAQYSVIRVGDDIRVLQRGEHLYIKQ